MFLENENIVHLFQINESGDIWKIFVSCQFCIIELWLF